MSAIIEQCGCGADFRIDDPKEIWTTAALDEALTNWRTTHIHAAIVEPGKCLRVLKATDSAVGALPTIFCRLRHGHAGAHEDDDGASWGMSEAMPA